MSPRIRYPNKLAVDIDRGSSVTSTEKVAKFMETSTVELRSEHRDRLRSASEDLDGLGLPQRSVDAQRPIPRDTTADLAPRKKRGFPERGEVRIGISGRQKRARTAARLAAQKGMSSAQQRELKRITTNLDAWKKVGDELSEHAGDKYELSTSVRRVVQSLDRTIQNAEKHNDRAHVVYAPVKLADGIDAQSILNGHVEGLKKGQMVEFDRYTMTAHQMHEAVASNSDAPVVVEMETRRGAYLGQGDHNDNTTHLLPRALKFEILETFTAQYRAPDGSIGERIVIRIRDVDMKDMDHDQ